ncbi:hypothetical protein MIND_00162700 [Mycena indigotica]|uniref:Uncharacterized protein n=1 Tax=Mycena indigotica TaxID=2126181 RepID=A0A8H6TGS4_9AGAR|nr:uncharacterized protein MIND_00162700 [Mycena indigotica]KAF7316437.1 hypothetical protein MIND_00162700 [Mycena indigotica]
MGDQVFDLERSWYIGNTCFAIIYGIQLCMFFLSSYFLWLNSKADKSRYIYIAYSATLLLLVTIAMACNLFFGQMMWIEHRDVEGGPVVFFLTNIAAWYNTFGTAADVTADLLSNGLMLYRCYVFYSGPNVWMVYIPALVLLASTAMSITATIQSGLPGGDFFHGITTNFTIPWLVLTITFNIITTGMISLRLFMVSRSMKRALTKERAEVYTSVIAILVESAAPFTLLGIGYLITYVRNAPESLWFADVWGGFLALAPQAIILRVAMGSAWSKQMVGQYTASKPGTAVVFASHTYPSESSGTALQTLDRSKGPFDSRNESTTAISKRSELDQELDP